MFIKTALLFGLLFSSVYLCAFDRNKSAEELECIELKTPGSNKKRSYDITPNTSYSISALVSASHKDIAWFEVHLFAKGKQLDFIRSIRADRNAERLEVVFNSGKADRAEVIFTLIPDAMPQSNAVFKEYRFVRCNDIRIKSWKAGNFRCRRREFTPDGAIVIYPQNGRGNSSGSTQLTQIFPHRKMRFSADVSAKYANSAMLNIYCSGKSFKAKSYKSKWNKKPQETLYVDFDTEDATWVSLELRCANGKKFRNEPVSFSNIKLTPIADK